MDFNGVTLDTDSKITNENKTYDTGYKATLKTAAQANYEIIITPATANANAVTGTSITGKLIVNDGTLATLALTSTDAALADIQNKDGEVQNVTINFTPRTVTSPAAKWDAQKWNTLVLPFDIEVADLSAKFLTRKIPLVQRLPSNSTWIRFLLTLRL